jgi:putative transposase
MFKLFVFLINNLFSIFLSKKALLIRIIILEKENDVLKRRLNGKKLKITYIEKIILAALYKITGFKNNHSIFRPETILKWQRELIKSFWTFKRKSYLRGRPPISEEIKLLVLKIKNENTNWGYKKIQGELAKLGIELDTKTIRNIIQDFRHKGKIRKSIAWKKFLEMQAQSIYAMDFFTVDTVLNTSFYVYFIIHHKSREIIRFAITRNPVRELVRQQIILFENSLKTAVYMIRDNAAQFNLDYPSYNIKEIKTSVKAPNMNSIAERFVGSARRECLDYYIIFNERQLRNILTEYINYYNTLRPHQGIGQAIPRGYVQQKDGRIRAKPILGGLHHHYFREVA